MDLWERGDDIRNYLAGLRPLRRLGVLIVELSQRTDSAFGRARASDPQLVRRAVERKRADPRRHGGGRPSVADWPLAMELTARVYDRLGELIAIQASHPVPKGAKIHKAPRPYPRPLTVQEQIEMQLRMEYLDSIDVDVAEAQERYRQLHAV